MAVCRQTIALLGPLMASLKNTQGQYQLNHELTSVVTSLVLLKGLPSVASFLAWQKVGLVRTLLSSSFSWSQKLTVCAESLRLSRFLNKVPRRRRGALDCGPFLRNSTLSAHSLLHLAMRTWHNARLCRKLQSQRPQPAVMGDNRYLFAATGSAIDHPFDVKHFNSAICLS